MSMTFKRRSFLTALADLLEAHNAEINETTDQNGIHVTVGGEYVDEGFYDVEQIRERLTLTNDERLPGCLDDTPCQQPGAGDGPK